MTVTLNFDEDMDQTVEPLTSDLSIDVDGVGKEPDSLNWVSATQMVIEYSEAVLGPVIVRLVLDQFSSTFRALNLLRVAPFDMLLVDDN